MATSSSQSELSERIRGAHTPTGAYIRSRRDSIDSVLPSALQRHQTMLDRVVHNEQDLADSHRAFYTASGVFAYSLHQMIKSTWNTLHPDDMVPASRDRVVNRHNPQGFEFLRAPGTPTSPELAHGPETFLDSRPGGWSDLSRPKEVLSTQLTPFGGVRTGGESTFEIFQSGGLHDVDRHIMGSALDNMLQQHGIGEAKRGQVSRLMQSLHGELTESERVATAGGHGKSSVMYQLFVPNDQVANLGYVSHNVGMALDRNPAGIYGNTIAGLQEQRVRGTPDPDAGTAAAQRGRARRGSFTEDVVGKATDERFWTTFKHDKTGRGHDPQVRLLMTRDHFQTPDGGVRIYTHRNINEGTASVLHTYQQQLRSILSPQPSPQSAASSSSAAASPPAHDLFAGLTVRQAPHSPTPPSSMTRMASAQPPPSTAPLDLLTGPGSAIPSDLPPPMAFTSHGAAPPPPPRRRVPPQTPAPPQPAAPLDLLTGPGSTMPANLPPPMAFTSPPPSHGSGPLLPPPRRRTPVVRQTGNAGGSSSQPPPRSGTLRSSPRSTRGSSNTRSSGSGASGHHE